MSYLDDLLAKRQQERTRRRNVSNIVSVHSPLTPLPQNVYNHSNVPLFESSEHRSPFFLDSPTFSEHTFSPLLTPKNNEKVVKVTAPSTPFESSPQAFIPNSPEPIISPPKARKKAEKVVKATAPSTPIEPSPQAFIPNSPEPIISPPKARKKAEKVVKVTAPSTPIELSPQAFIPNSPEPIISPPKARKKAEKVVKVTAPSTPIELSPQAFIPNSPEPIISPPKARKKAEKVVKVTAPSTPIEPSPQAFIPNSPEPIISPPKARKKAEKVVKVTAPLRTKPTKVTTRSQSVDVPEGVRRSSRNRLEPLKFWKNERPLYDKNGTLIGTQKATHPTPMAVRPVTRKRTTSSSNENTKKLRLPDLEFPDNIQITNVLTDPSDLVYRQVPGLDQDEKGLIEFADAFEIDFLNFKKRSGNFRLHAGAIKKKEFTDRLISLLVLDGRVKVDVNGHDYELKKGAWQHIKPKSEWSVENLNKKTSVVYFDIYEPIVHS
ncbi:hypothetical protein RCL1_007154 [Eukaryota sp. TZLM3-RCL]